MGRNTRTVTLVGSDNEIHNIYNQLLNDPTMGYRIQGYYADEKQEDWNLPWLRTIKELRNELEAGEHVAFGDEMYVCLYLLRVLD